MPDATDESHPDDLTAETAATAAPAAAPELPARLGITGAGGLIGRQVLAALDRAGFRGTVVAVDLAEAGDVPAFVEWHQVDATTADATDVLAGCDTVVHLAYILAPTTDPETERATNLALYDRVAEAAARPGGPRHLVVLSSATVYGAYPNNPLPLDEDAPLRPNEGFVYAVCKAEIERRCGELVTRVDGLTIARLRPAIVFGPHARNYLAEILTAPLPVGSRGERPPLQFVHERDVADAVVHAVAHRLDGAYNVAADGWITPEELDRLTGFRPPLLRLPPDAQRRMAARMFAAGLSPLAPASLPYVRFPWVVANTRLVGTGWTPRYGNEQTFRATLDAMRKRRKDAKAGRTPKAVAAAAAAGVAVAGVAAVRARGRR